MILDFPDYTISIRRKLRTRSKYNYVLIHGFAADNREMIRLAHKLHDGNIYALDLLDHGHSVLKNRSLKLSYQLICRAIEDVIKRLKLENIIIIGHSVGALIATVIGSTNANVKKIILLSPPPIKIAKNKALITRLMSTDIDVLKGLVRNEFYYQPHKLTVAFMAHMIMRKNFKLVIKYRKFVQDLSDSISTIKFNTYLRKIKKPTLIISGMEDPISIPADIATISKHINYPHNLVMIPKARHSLCLQRAHQVLTIIKRWN